MTAALLATGRRAVADLLRTAGPLAQGHQTSFQRVFSAASWSGLHLACLLTGFPLNHLVPDGPVVLVGGDTGASHPGRKVYGKARPWRCSTNSCTPCINSCPPPSAAAARSALPSTCTCGPATAIGTPRASVVASGRPAPITVLGLWHVGAAASRLAADGRRLSGGSASVLGGHGPHPHRARPAAGVRLQWLLLDRGFYDAQVVHWLQQAQVPFVMLLIRRGDPDQGTGTHRFFRSPTGWYDYSWTARPRAHDAATGRQRKQAALPVHIRVCVVGRPAQKPWVYACWGIAWDMVLVQQRYRRRFGIETSYRQLGQSLARTTSTDERVRLLLVGWRCWCGSIGCGYITRSGRVWPATAIAGCTRSGCSWPMSCCGCS